MNPIQKFIQHNGIPVSVRHSDELKHGTAVIYPVRYQQKSSGNMTFSEQGYDDNGKFMFFAEPSLLDGATYGDIISDNGHQYMLLWKNRYSCQSISYVQAGLQIISDGGDTH